MRDRYMNGVLVGRPHQSSVQVSTTQNYPIGTIWEHHGRRFRYCRTTVATTQTHLGLPNVSLHGGDTGGTAYAVMGTIATAGVKGDNFINMANVGTGTLQTIFPLDWFYDGTINFYVPHADYTDLLSMRISGSEVASATNVKLWLDEPLPVAIAATVFAEAHPSPYLNVGAHGQSAKFSIVVINHVELSALDYFWGQTRGPCYVQRNVGVDTHARMKVFTTPGSIMEDQDTNDIRQTIGYSLTPNVSDGMVMLQLE